MRASRRRRVLAGAVSAVPAVLVVGAPPGPAAASPAPATTAPPSPPPPAAEPGEPAAPYCATRLLSAAELEAGERSAVRCFDTFEGSLRAIGVEPGPLAAAGTSPAAVAASELVIANDNVLATHFDDYNGRGSVLTIGGAGCDGGGITLSAGDYWNDRIRSTTPQACSKVKHWSDANYAGSTEVAAAPLNLSSALAGRVSSIRYYA